MKTRLFSLLVALCAISNLFADFKEGNLYYNRLNNNEVEIVDCAYGYEDKGAIEIPEKVRGYVVTSIGYAAFYARGGLTAITIPNSVTSIGDGAFYGCASLTSVTIPNSVASIGIRAFCYCTGLTSVTIPNSVTSIGSGVFSGCTDITSIVVESDNTVYDSRNNCNAIIETSTNTLIQGCKTTIIPNNVTSIGDDAFYGCTGLTSVSIPDNVTNIGNGAFSLCTGLTSVTIPNSVTSIGNSAFRGCTGLTSVTIPNSVTSIGYRAFCECTGLASLTIPNSVTSIGGLAFDNTPWLKNQPDGVIYINQMLYTYKGEMPANTSIVVRDKTTHIIGNAFHGCRNIVSITLPNSIIDIGSYAFYGCTDLTSVSIPDNVTSIGDDAFSGCTGLTSITIPNNVTNMGKGVFSNCSTLQSVIWNANKCHGWEDYSSPLSSPFCGESAKTITFGDNVDSIPVALCAENSSLTQVFIPNSVKHIGSGAFRGCTNLTSVTLPNSVTSIGSGAFKGCTGLTSVIIPNSVTSIGSSAFDGCTSITSVSIGNSVTSIGSSAFDGCTGLTSVTIGNSVTSIGSYAFVGCTGLTSITIPNSVTNIGNRAFYKCTGLKKIIVLPAQCPFYDESSFYCQQIDTVAVLKCYLEAYKSIQWGGFTEDKFYTHKLSVHIVNNDATLGNLLLSTQDTLLDCGESITAKAEPYFGCIFTQWSDGNTENPRTIEVDNEDISLMALFAKVYSGACGETAQWQYANGTLSITGTDTMYDYVWDNVPWWLFRDSIQQVSIAEGISSIGAYGFTGLSKRTNITVPNSVIYIGDNALSGNSQLTTIALPNSITYIGDKALSDNNNLETVSMGENIDTMGDSVFSNDPRLYQITCKTQRVPTISEKTFSGMSSRVPIYVQAACVNKYRVHEYLGRQNIRSLGELTTYTVTAGCDLRFGVTTGGGTYFEGESVTLAAIPNKGYVFVRWSNGATANPYIFAASENLTLEAQFAPATGVENVQNEGTCSAKKIIRNGQVFIVRNGRVYTMTGVEIE